MRIAGIIAEYNPFHNGHAWHIARTREAGCDAVIACMVGHFTQRGEPAILSKWDRARMAFAVCGAHGGRLCPGRRWYTVRLGRGRIVLRQ